ncbi:hypothetical protein V1506DRAFT_545205 [Lipomyces tetrasporus]
MLRSVSLVCFDELPRFRNPGTLHDHVGDVSAEMDRMAQSIAEKAKNDSSQGFYGYIEYRGHKWVGDLNQAFIEVWRANERQPTRYLLIQNAWSCNCLPKTIGL